MTLPDPHLRPATPADAQAIVELIGPYVATGLILPRTVEEIRERHADFVVAESAGRVTGCVALRDYGAGLQEIRSLAVSTTVAGAGVGSSLVAAAVELAARRGAKRVFALTMRPGLFVRQGFVIVEHARFPQKVWSDCATCRKRDHCDEVALLLELPCPAAG